MPTALENEFNAAMLNIYNRAKSEAGYNATRYLHMVGENGGLETTRYLIHSKNVSDGYTALWERGRLDLTLTSFIIDNTEYHELFTAKELEICRKRLKEYKYQPG